MVRVRLRSYFVAVALVSCAAAGYIAFFGSGSTKIQFVRNGRPLSDVSVDVVITSDGMKQATTIDIDQHGWGELAMPEAKTRMYITIRRRDQFVGAFFVTVYPESRQVVELP